jgi:hypothetical protein
MSPRHIVRRGGQMTENAYAETVILLTSLSDARSRL